MITSKIAWRNLWRSRLRSSIVIASIVVGIWAGLFISALSVGMNDQRTENTIASTISHVQIHDSVYLQEKLVQYYLQQEQDMVQILDDRPEVAAYAQRVKTPRAWQPQPWAAHGVSIVR
ncbi:MAG: hypothetical protein HC842_08300, partial [Cytophagales bacterium]|nr:hypothetical protein [Cytophagales bacterium]